MQSGETAPILASHRLLYYIVTCQQLSNNAAAAAVADVIDALRQRSQPLITDDILLHASLFFRSNFSLFDYTEWAIKPDHFKSL